ncbi:MAG: nucleotidyltransferase family protein [Patescibacteria group bacterium]
MLNNKIISYIYQKIFHEEYLIEQLLKLSIGNCTKIDVIRLFKIKQNWVKVMRLIKENQLENIIYQTIYKNHLEKYIPQDILKKINIDNLIMQYLISLQKKEFEGIIINFSKKKIDFLVMKTFLYKKSLQLNTISKIRNDLDLLIPIHQFKKAAKLLFYLGYKYYPDHYEKKGKSSIEEIDFYIPQSQEIFKKNKISIELHTTIVDTFDYFKETFNLHDNQIITEYLYKDHIYVNKNPPHIKVFSPTSLLISLFLHSFIQHNFQSSSSLYEAFVIYKKYNKEIDWQKIEKLMLVWKLEQYFIIYVILLHDFFSGQYDKNISTYLHNYHKKLSFKDKIIYSYLRYKLLHPSKFLVIGEKEKEWTRAIISNKVLRLIMSKIRDD